MQALEFDWKRHRYTCGGVLVPNVTTVLESVLDTLAGIPAEALAFARDRGTAVHKATELYDRGILDIAALDPMLVPYLEGWRKFLRETDFVPVGIEERVFHRRHWYAGTLDRTGELFGDTALLDIKSGALTASAGPQTAAYQAARDWRRADKIKRRFVVQLTAEGGYKLHHMDEKADLSVFLSALNIYTWRKKHDH